ncbi:MAG TPA: hypothetical protein VH352_25225 [Pseudonocardiaceae bacterium]|nr:hypothetical protein [Pseudonocardiaceae bacterium]
MTFTVADNVCVPGMDQLAGDPSAFISLVGDVTFVFRYVII